MKQLNNNKINTKKIQSKGFSLIEAMISLTILSIGLLGQIQSQMNMISTRNQD